MRSKYIHRFLWVMSFLMSGCCTNYCAESYSHELIGISLYDKSTGELIQDNVMKANFQLDSRGNNDSFLEDNGNPNLELNLSIAGKKGMEDVLTLTWLECNCTIAALAIEYEIYGDNDCCETRSVKVKEIKSNCTDDNLEFVQDLGRVSEISIMVEI